MIHLKQLVEFVVMSTSGDENDIIIHVAKYGPTTIVIDGSSWFFQTYTSGIFDYADSCLPNYSNHAVCCVGYGTENNIDYWIVRNSWGEEGYVRMIRNSRDPYIFGLLY